MRKIAYILAIALIGAVLISGCISKDPQEENEILPFTPRPTVTPGSYANGQEERFNFDEPTFIMRGFVTYQEYSIMADGPEYSIDLVIQSVTNSPVTFNKIVAFYDDQGYGRTVESIINQVTLGYGQAIEPNIQTHYLQEMQRNVETAGKKTIVMHICLKNDDEDISGDYEASLPPLFYMETLGSQSHQIIFAKNSVS